MTMMKPMGVVAGVCGLGFIGYCVYFDHKRRSDPDFKKKLKQSKFILFYPLNSILVNNNDNVGTSLKIVEGLEQIKNQL